MFIGVVEAFPPTHTHPILNKLTLISLNGVFIKLSPTPPSNKDVLPPFHKHDDPAHRQSVIFSPMCRSITTVVDAGWDEDKTQGPRKPWALHFLTERVDPGAPPR